MKTYASLLVVCLANSMLFESPASAQDLDVTKSAFSLKLEPAAAIPLNGPQRDFGIGVGGMVKGAYAIAAPVDLQLTGMYAGFPDSSTGTTPGMAGVGGGARFQRPHRAGRISPWADMDLLYVGTGGLNRFSFTGAAGVNVAATTSRNMWLGLFVRYLHIVQPNVPSFDDTDGKFFMVGISAEAGISRVSDSDGDKVPDTRDHCPTVMGPAANQGCPILDADGDGVGDKADQCDDVPGPLENAGCPEEIPDTDGDGLLPPEDKCPAKAGARDNDGCPLYKTIKVTTKRIELGQKIFFAFGKSTILPRSFELLDDVAQALKDYPGMLVRIEGHTDGVGLSSQNMALSEERAAAVMRYMIEHGVERDRLSSIGYGDTLPLESNTTVEGREKNRRVEFVVVSAKVAERTN